MRDFACRLVRRTLGTKTASVLGANFLAVFQRIVEDSEGEGPYEVALDVERLLNTNQVVEVSLTATLVQPLSPGFRRAVRVVPGRVVKPLHGSDVGRPRNPIAYLTVGGGANAQPIALTYDLFKAVKELERGMSPASLSGSVVALLDAA